MSILKSSLTVVAILVLISCNRSKDQWVLQSYDVTNGYTFVRNGIEYRAKCVATGRPVLGTPPNEIPDLNPDAMPPDVVSSQSSCEDILPYLSKPVPKLRQVGVSLVLTEEKNYKLEFEIIHAK
jgi:hypothetical protein